MPTKPATSQIWTDAFSDLPFQRTRCLRPGEELLALLRAAHHLSHDKTETDLMHSILIDAVAVLDAQRGAIVLADDQNQLHLRALAGDSGGNPHYCQRLAERCILEGESVLCGSVDKSVAPVAMVSVLCVLLRTAHRRLGVLHLDRGAGRLPFNEDDLHLANALAVYLSMGVECARLTPKSTNQQSRV